MSMSNIFEIKEEGCKFEGHDAREAVSIIANAGKGTIVWFRNPIIGQLKVWHEGEEDYSAKDDPSAVVDEIWGRIYFAFENYRQRREEHAATAYPITIVPMVKITLAQLTTLKKEKIAVTMDPYGYNLERVSGGADIAFHTLPDLIKYMRTWNEPEVFDSLYEQLVYIVLNTYHLEQMQKQLTELSYSDIFKTEMDERKS